MPPPALLPPLSLLGPHTLSLVVRGAFLLPVPSTTTTSPTMAEPLDCALDLMRRLPPSQIEDNLAGLIDLVPDLCEHLLSAVDQPLKIAHDAAAKKDYLLCDYNRDGDSYRYVELLYACASVAAWRHRPKQTSVATLAHHTLAPLLLLLLCDGGCCSSVPAVPSHTTRCSLHRVLLSVCDAYTRARVINRLQLAVDKQV